MNNMNYNSAPHPLLHIAAIKILFSVLTSHLAGLIIIDVTNSAGAALSCVAGQVTYRTSDPDFSGRKLKMYRISCLHIGSDCRVVISSVDKRRHSIRPTLLNFYPI